MPAAGLIGRDVEIGAIRAVLDRAGSGPAGIVVEGEAGIGKTALLEATARLWSEQGFLVLASRGAEAEASWSLLAVGDLLEGVPAEVVAVLPAPQRRALDVVMRRSESEGPPVEQPTIGAGLRSVLTVLAEERPVLLLLDDVHWMDDASAGVLGYVLRRLGNDRVAVVGARRLPEPSRLDLARLLPEGASDRLRVGPLSAGALRLVLEPVLPAPLTRSTLLRVHEASHGNPLFALEIAQVLAETGVPPVGEPLPGPDDVQELIRRRVATLPEPTGRLLLRVALEAGPVSAVPLSSLDETALVGLGAAERAGIVRLDGGVLRFAHPFHAAAVLAGATPATVRELRRQLADATSSPEERARHLARSVDVADAAIAAEVQAGADAAVARGAPFDAANLLERAWKLTPPHAAALARTRALRAAEYYIQLGEIVAAEAILSDLGDLGDLSGRETAEVLRLRAEIRFVGDDLTGALPLLTEALERDPQAHRCTLALMAVAAQRRDFARARELSRQLQERLDPATDGPMLADVLAYTVMTDFLAGKGIDWVRLNRAVELEDLDQVPVGTDPPSTCAAYLTAYARRFDEARPRLLAVRDDLDARGLADGFIYTWLAWLEIQCGNFASAAAYCDEGVAVTDLVGNASVRAELVGRRALVDVYRGDLDAARHALDEVDTAAGAGRVAVRHIAVAAEMLAGLSEGRFEQAWDACRAEVETVEREGLVEPSIVDWIPDAVEAMIGVGLTDRAGALIESWEGHGRALGYPWVLALGARCRAVLEAAAGDHAAAIAAADEALDHLGAQPVPFHRARVLLVRGTSQRRARRRTDARASLSEALAEFERMGARLWAERAREELARIGGRAPSGGALSASERRVAELAARGESNKEIAATLTVSVHTVERHLSHAFAKLGITRRGQLAGRLADEDARTE